jgi:hypothetical protein
MNTNELIKLANVADKDGDLELADFIDRELLAMSNNKNIREAAYDWSAVGKAFKPLGNALGKIPEFFGAGKYKAGPMDTAADLMMMQGNPNKSGNAFQKLFGAVDKEIDLDANQLKALESKLGYELFETFDQADDVTRAAINKVINKQTGLLSVDEKKLLMEHARKTGIVGRRTDADFQDIQDLIDGKSLSARPRTVQRVNKNTKLVGGAGAAMMAAPGLYGAFAGQGPDTTGSAVPNGPMGMPQLDPMGGFGGGGGNNGGGGMGGGVGGYNGPQVGGPPVNTMMDPASMQRGESGGYAPTSGYTGRSEREINPAAKFRTNEVGMMRGEAPPVYNNYSAGYNPGTQTSVAPVADVYKPLDSIPPVAVPTAQELAGQPGFGGATDSAGIAKELAGDPDAPETPSMTPAQIQNAMNPLATSGY